MGGTPDRHEVVAILATYGNRMPEQVPERIDSLDLVWLIHQVEQRYAVSLDLSDEALSRMSTVDAAVVVLREAMAGEVPA
jgi:acyl carrier protein